MATLRTPSLRSPLSLSIPSLIKPLIYILFFFIGTGFAHVIEPAEYKTPIVLFPQSHTCGVNEAVQLNSFTQGQTINVKWAIDTSGECSIYLSPTGLESDFQMIDSFSNCGKDFQSPVTLPNNVITNHGTLRFQWSPGSPDNTFTSCADISISPVQSIKKQRRKRNNVKRIPRDNSFEPEKRAASERSAESELAKRGWWDGWWKRSASSEPESLKKRGWWDGWWKRSVSPEPELAKRGWWDGWWKRSTSPEPELAKRGWWDGWWKRSASPESESLEKRGWWDGWWKRSASPESESLKKRGWWDGWWKRSESLEPESEKLD
ncbi:4378_t:CDS:2 [Cetraspora pellucida]|uniref:4378_t:CDS:1 n=1 Tax=Cetraspora pellucida TaxID=1433469 RepID=A0A9N9IBM3_9GLOM|nr:4378_t:CDS:2 [Cetraspora pellucida]